MNEDITFKKGEFGYVEYKSSNPFEFHQIINDFDKAPMQDLQGWLLFPEKFSGKLSCMVCVHHSGGWGGAQHEFMVQLLEAGYAVFKVDSFDARGVTNTAEDQISVTYAMLMADAYEALNQYEGGFSRASKMDEYDPDGWTAQVIVSDVMWVD